MSTLWLDGMETESLVIAKDEHVAVSNVACVAVITGRARALGSDGRECKVVDRTCSLTSLVGLEDDTNVILFYGECMKKARLETFDEERVQNLITEYGERLLQSLKAYHGLPIALTSHKVSVQGTIVNFEIDRHRFKGREYPRIGIMISTGNTLPLTHIEFTHELLRLLPPRSHILFWERAKIKQGDKWIKIDKILPLKVRSFTDKAMLEACIQ